MTTKEAVKHTPGPWTTTGFHGRTETIRSQSDTGVCIAMMPHWRDDCQAEKEANARLIAAAPEMLGALKALVALLEFDEEATHPGTDTWVALKRAEALIAQVEGR